MILAHIAVKEIPSGAIGISMRGEDLVTAGGSADTERVSQVAGHRLCIRAIAPRHTHHSVLVDDLQLRRSRRSGIGYHALRLVDIGVWYIYAIYHPHFHLTVIIYILHIQTQITPSGIPP